MLDLEAYCQQAIDHLQATLGERLEELSTPTLELPIPEPSAYTLGVISSVLSFPNIEVAAPDWTLNEFSIERESGAMSFPLIVRAMLIDPNYDQLVRSLYRYNQAIIELMLQPRALGDGVITDVTGAIRANPQLDERQDLVGGCIIVLTVETEVEVP